MNEIGKNRLNWTEWTKVDRTRLKWAEIELMDQSGS